MSSYIDTSIILARYLPSDPKFQAVDSFFKKSSGARYISEISILELYCVFSRILRAGMLKPLPPGISFEDLSVEEKVTVVVEHAIRTWRLRIAATERSYLKLPVGKQTLQIGHELFEAIRVSAKLGLKTLDTLHLAYASTIRELEPDLQTFTTLDKEITARREEIEKEMHIKVLEPTLSS